MTILTREAWLHSAIDAMRPWFDEAGKPLPENLRVSVGFPVGSRKATGQCFFEDAAPDGIPQIFISPVLDAAAVATSQGVLATLIHECAHAALPIKTGHRKAFAKLAETLGLCGPWTATTAGALILPRLETLAYKLGPFPHGILNPKLVKKRANPNNKVVCGECQFTAYVTLKMIAEHATKHGTLSCPSCGASGWGTDSDFDPEGEGE